MNTMILVLLITFILLLELASFLLVKNFRKRFQWLITPEDEYPVLEEVGLNKFFAHGHDPELGWIRKPNTSHDERGRGRTTFYNIDERGARRHPGMEKYAPHIACYGDSFTFCRQVNDDETWPYRLSVVSGLGVVNFGVGNYGADQAYLRMLRESRNCPAPIVLLGVVPSTIVRVLCVWKHYNEFGNTFAFKPRFDINGGELVLIKNIIDDRSKFGRYRDYIDIIRKNDYFYKTKFRDEMIKFPYSVNIIRKPGRNISIIGSLLLSSLLGYFGKKNRSVDDHAIGTIMRINRTLRYKLYNNKYAVDVLSGVVKAFCDSAREAGARPVFVLLPQKDDITFIKKRGNYYEEFLKNISREMIVIDLTAPLLDAKDLDKLYSDDTEYGGHPSREGNEFIARYIYGQLEASGILKAQSAAERKI